MDIKELGKISRAIDETINDKLYRLVVSKPLQKGEISKITLRPVLLQGELKFQETIYKGTQVFHENLTAGEAKKKITSYLENSLFGQLDSECADKKVMILTNKKGTVTVKIKRFNNSENVQTDLKNAVKEHNRTKKYILPDGEPVDFLVALGVQTTDGKVVKAKYDKFKQINRYLEFVQDILPALEGKDTVRIVDFGCGKSYLTFALYYYLKLKLNYKVQIIGLDLKKDVIANCNQLKDKLGYSELAFLHGDIKDYDGSEEVDMVVTLHACDTATDYAIEKAVKWNASVIMTVPCCQHELNKQMKANEIPDLQGILKYSLIKERMAALITDAYRANCLEQVGYEVQIMEFIDMEHTPKNILLRAVKSKKMKTGKESNLHKLDDFLGIEPTLEKLLFSGEE